MTSRKKFERWALRQKLQIGRRQEVTRDGPRWAGYFEQVTQVAWLAWTAAMRRQSAEGK